jgi:outer membrane phospholipase A
MKKTQDSETNQNLEDDLLPEYNFNYNKAHPNRFAAQGNETKITVTLESDVAKVFKTSEDVNKALRAILSAIPEK